MLVIYPSDHQFVFASPRELRVKTKEFLNGNEWELLVFVAFFYGMVSTLRTFNSAQRVIAETDLPKKKSQMHSLVCITSSNLASQMPLLVVEIL